MKRITSRSVALVALIVFVIPFRPDGLSTVEAQIPSTAKNPSPSPKPGAITPAAPGTGPKLPIGMNLAGFGDYSPGFPFKNLMWGARGWLTKNIDDSGPFNGGFAAQIPIDAEGYPLEIPYQPSGATQPQVVYTILPNVVEPGRYVVLYDGKGEIGVAQNTRLISSKPGRVVIEITSGGNPGKLECIIIKRSSRRDHIRNILVLAMADEKANLRANPFRRDFLEYCKQWHALRFMDWMATNNSFIKDWDDRKRPDFYTMTGGGGDAIGRWGKPPGEYERRFSAAIAPEFMIQLANLTRTDPWFCMPHRATPEYMSEFAKLVKAHLAPGLKVYVEYSNEVWNWSFFQAGWMLQSKVAADAVIAAGGTAWKNKVEPELPYDNGTVAKEGGEGHPERMAALNRRCFAAWEDVFTGKDRARLVRVVGVQHAWADTARRTAKWVIANGGADAIASGGYFGPDGDTYKRWEAAGASLTAKQVVADMDAAFEKGSAPWSREIAAIAKECRLSFLVYEGGQHIQPQGQNETPYMPALKAAQFHPGLAQVYMKNFALHQELGCELFMAYNSISLQGSRWGSWGHQEFYGQSRKVIPKYGALIDANAPKQ